MLKNSLTRLVELFNRLTLVPAKGLNFNKSKAFLFRFKSQGKNHCTITKSSVMKSLILVSGSNNEISCTNALIDGSTITLEGTGNKLIIRNGAKLRRANIQVRGTGCRIEIGENTTFGQVRIVNVGHNNPVIIGSNCLFADDIEIWASDTHSIYNESGQFINPEKPVTIEDRVWIGSHVRIMKGVVIGSGAIIGMNSMVTKDIPQKSLCAGSPTRLIKQGVSWSLKYENEDSHSA